MAAEQGDAEVEDTAGAEGGGAAHLERDDAAGEGGAEDDAHDAEEAVAAEAPGVEEVDVDGGGVGGEEVVVDAEEELVVPGGISVAGGVQQASAELVGRIHPGGGVHGRGPGGRVELLGGDDGELQEVEGGGVEGGDRFRAVDGATHHRRRAHRPGKMSSTLTYDCRGRGREDGSNYGRLGTGLGLRFRAQI